MHPETDARPSTEAPPRLSFNALPPLRSPLMGGIFAGVTTTPDGTHHAVVLLPGAPPTQLDWKSAMAWADEIKASLPSRPVAAMLFANVLDEFRGEWHWTCEELNGSLAWGQHFGHGTQFYYPKSYEGRARAVRLIQLTA